MNLAHSVYIYLFAWWILRINLSHRSTYKVNHFGILLNFRRENITEFIYLKYTLSKLGNEMKV